jgi:hypothetical protein
VLEWLGAGHSAERLLANYEGRVPAEALREAAALAGKALVRQVAGRAVRP